jgi:uncharacterized protein (DUF927 family)
LGFGEATSVVYTLTGEIGKARLRSDATAKTPYTWRTVALSTGETSLAARLEEDRRGGRKGPRGGTLVRAVDIAIDRAHGAFDQPKDDPNFDPSDFSNQMKGAAETYYGTAGPAFVVALIDNGITADRVRQNIEKFVKDVLKDLPGQPGDKGQIQRVAARFGLVAVAGALACAFHVVDWDAEELVAGVKEMFRTWLRSRGSIGPVEERQMIAAVRSYLEQYGDSRFTDGELYDPDRKIPTRSGYYKGSGNDRRWLIFQETWAEICVGFDPKDVARRLIDKGLMERGDGNHLAKRETVQGKDGTTLRPRFYVVKGTILEN